MLKPRLHPLAAGFLTKRKTITASLILVGIISNCFAIFLSLSIGIYYQSLGNHHSTKGDILALFHISLPASPQRFFTVFLLLIVATSVFEFLFRWGSQHIASGFSLMLKKKIFRHHIRMEMKYFSKKPVGAYLLRYSGELKNIQYYLEKGVFRFTRDIVFIALGLVILFSLHLQASIYVVSVLLAGFFLLYFISRVLKKLNNQRSDMISSDLSFIHDHLHCLETIKIWNREFKVISRFNKKTEGLRKHSLKVAFWKNIFYTLPFTILFILLFLIFLTHKNTTGINSSSFIPYILLLILLFPAVKRVMRISTTWKSGVSSLQKIHAILRLPLESKRYVREYLAMKGRIEFKNVSFSYDGNKQIFHNFNITFEKNNIHYIYFNGKTTLLKLLIGLYKPDKGVILMDGIDYRRLSIKSIRKHIAFASAQIILQGNTIAKNLCPSNGILDTEKAQRLLHMLNFSAANKNGGFDLDFNIGRSGRILSQTDKQKLIIARTLLSNKGTLLFDNIIENQEPLVQQAIIKYLDQVKYNKIIIIAGNKLVDTYESTNENKLFSQEVRINGSNN